MIIILLYGMGGLVNCIVFVACAKYYTKDGKGCYFSHTPSSLASRRNCFERLSLLFAITL